MSYHHDEDNKTVITHSGNNNTTSRHHLHLKPTVVFDHLKTKVKRKLPSNNALPEIPPFKNYNNNINGTGNGIYIPKRSSQEQNELELKVRAIEPRSTQIVSARRLSDHNSDISSGKQNSELDLTKVKDENNAVVPNYVDKDEGINELTQLRSNPPESDIDSNQKNTKSKFKRRVSTSFSESTNNQPNSEKRRKPVRQTVQAPSKTQLNNTYNRTDSYNMGSLDIHDEDFNNFFTDLPSDEQLVIAYPCVWQKDIPLQGRIFLTVNYLCFHTYMFKTEESLCIVYKDIISVTKQKSTDVVPSAIQLRTKTQEQYLFTSNTPIKRIYTAIFRLWKNASLEKPLDYQQLRTIFTVDQMTIDESTGDSEEATIPKTNVENNPDRSALSQTMTSRPLNHSREPSLALTQSNDKTNSQLPIDKGQAIYALLCPCETHLTRTYADRSFTFHVDQLFELIFGNNSFTRAYHDSQKLTDYTIGEWHINNETGKRERAVTYKTVTQSIFGTNTLTCNEKQTMEVDKPHSMYVMNTEVFNEGMRYTDTFFVATRFCMFQRDVKYSTLRVTGEVRYVKSVNGIAKSFIEKNCHSSVEDGINCLVRKLENEQTNATDRKSSPKQTSGKKRSRKHKDDGINPDDNHVSTLNNPVLSDNQIGVKEKMNIEKRSYSNMMIFIGVLLIILHIYLCYKLYDIDQALYNPDRICLDECKQVCSSHKKHP